MGSAAWAQPFTIFFYYGVGGMGGAPARGAKALALTLLENDQLSMMINDQLSLMSFIRNSQ